MANKEVAESVLELLLLGIVAEYTRETTGRQGSEAALLKLEAIGARVGERLVERDTRDRARLQDPLDAVKYVCKDVWTAVCKKPVDSLKTNKGVRMMYVMHDSRFRWLSHVSAPRPSPIDRSTSSSSSPPTPPDSQQAAVAVAAVQERDAVYAPYTALFGGIIRGALAALGVAVTVTAEVFHTTPPGVAFTARTTTTTTTPAAPQQPQ